MATCKTEGCFKNSYSRGLCRKHYRIYLKNRDPDIVIHKKTGYKKYPEHQVWWSMKNRCYCKTHNSYKNYGGRGIKVCESWLNDFINFINDMGSRPTSKHQIDRIDNDGDYTPSNCRWVTKTENNRKTRASVLNKEKVLQMRRDRSKGMLLKDIASKYGIHKNYASSVCRKVVWKDI